MKYFGCIFILFNLVFASKNIAENELILSINTASVETTILKHFWSSTGFCPLTSRNNISNYFMSEDVKRNLMLISALPNKSIKQIRIHWILDVIHIRDLHNGTLVFDFKDLDLLINWLHRYRLRLGFEFMGNPSSFFDNFLNNIQARYWQDLVTNVVLRYTELYGIKYVSKWRFETWNEPDLKMYNIFNFSLSAYMEYVYACSNGLRAAGIHSQDIFKLGGPAGLFKSQDKHPLCWGLISKCNNKSQNCPLHFISFHKKGDSTASGVLNKSLELVNYIHAHFPNVRRIPIANDEADILTGWSKSVDWRGDVRYAAMVVKVIVDHFEKFVRELGIKVEVLSNDNAFLNYHPYYFTQRTLLARFQMNNTNPHHIQFFKKPVYVAMALLSYLGRDALKRPINVKNNLLSILTTTSMTKERFEFSSILSYVNDTTEDTNLVKLVHLVVKNLPSFEYKYIVYMLDNVRTNPYLVWMENGSPVFPNFTVRQQLRTVEGPYRVISPTDLPPNVDLQVNLKMALPSVVLLHVCSRTSYVPGKVTNLRAFNVTHNEVFLVWSDRKIDTKCVQTYEIEYLSDAAGNEIRDQLFRRVNSADVIFLWYQHVATGLPEAVRGSYRVRAVDYWNRPGPYSLPIRYPRQY